MLVKSQVKYIQSLGHKKFRDTEGVFVAEGPKIVNELLEAENLELVECFATSAWLENFEGQLKGRDQCFFEVDEKDLVRISSLTSPNQVLAIFTKPVFRDVRHVDGITLLLETIQDPGNLGTIIRTADWFGVKRIVCSEDTADVFSSKVVQSAMGSIIRTELIYTDLESFILEHRDWPLYASSLDGADLEGNIRLQKALLLMGNESRGVSEKFESMAVQRVRIPRHGGAESLNVSVAAGILLSRLK